MGEAVANTARTVGRYAIFDEIASGGMATVYLGRLMGSGGFTRTVAIKQLHPQFAKDPEFVTMFLDEARLAARIRHPNVVPTLDVVASRGEVFLVMEYVQGESLSRLARTLRAQGERVPLPILVRVMSDALQGLHAAHEARDERGVPLDIVHRDVTPQNVLVGIDGVGRLLDFGVAKAAGRAHTTREGQIKGKLAYMAPEQLTNSGVTRQTDLYAAAVVLWEMLTGERLFAGGSEVDVVAKLLTRDIRRPSQLVPDLPKVFDEVVMKGLAADPAQRFATAREMCLALSTCGVAEAPGVVVGAWVEQLAAEALAHRTAAIAAIESSSVSTASVANVHSIRPSIPTAVDALAAPPPREHRDRDASAATEPSSEVLSLVASANALRRDTRVRITGAAAAAGIVLVGGAALMLGWFRAAPRDVPLTGTESPRAPATAPIAPAPALAVPVPEPRATAAATALTVASSPPPSAAALAPPIPRAPKSPTRVAGPRPSSARPAQSEPKDVFESRE